MSCVIQAQVFLQIKALTAILPLRLSILDLAGRSGGIETFKCDIQSEPECAMVTRLTHKTIGEIAQGVVPKPWLMH